MTTCERLHFLGIDIGVVHLAIANASTSQNYDDLQMHSVQLINTMVLEHTRVSRHVCPLHHSGMAVDRVAHVVQEHQALFDGATIIVIERQPPGGLRDVEQVLVTMFRHKAEVMCPQTMHAHIGSSGVPYLARKAISIEVASEYMADLVHTFPDKTDDVADAICLVVTYIQKTKKKRDKEARCKAALEHAKERGLDMEMFRYTGPMRNAGYKK